MGGQEAQNLALPLFKVGCNVLGTNPLMIDRCEDRFKFSSLLDQLGVAQPAWRELTTLEKVEEFAREVGYPVLFRSSYVLSGAAMKVAWGEEELRGFLGAAAEVSKVHPVVVTKFVEGARELELDAVARGGEIVNWAILEHIEDAGVHSGDSTLVCISSSPLPSAVPPSPLHILWHPATPSLPAILPDPSTSSVAPATPLSSHP